MNQGDLMTSTLSVSIPTYSEKVMDKKPVTFFNVEIYNNFSKQRWTMEKRYSEFDDVQKKVFKLIKTCPQLPGKSFFSVKHPDAINKRKNQLEQFLKECVARKDIVATDDFKEFLEIEKNSPELSVNPPVLLSSYDGLPLGVRDFVYMKYENLMLIATCDMELISRFDAYLTNVNLPWEKKTEAHISVGAVFAYKVSGDTSSGYNFEKLWAKSFPKQVDCF